jgi:hypothetical protein
VNKLIPGKSEMRCDASGQAGRQAGRQPPGLAKIKIGSISASDTSKHQSSGWLVCLSVELATVLLITASQQQLG